MSERPPESNRHAIIAKAAAQMEADKWSERADVASMQRDLALAKLAQWSTLALLSEVQDRVERAMHHFTSNEPDKARAVVASISDLLRKGKE